jgi:hypothetical protein
MLSFKLSLSLSLLLFSIDDLTSLLHFPVELYFMCLDMTYIFNGVEMQNSDSVFNEQCYKSDPRRMVI